MDEANRKFLESLAIAPDDAADAYLDIDEFTNALDYLAKTESFLQHGADPFRWKWAALSLSNALYGFMICALTRGNYENVLTYKKMKKVDREILGILWDIGTADTVKLRHDILEGCRRRGEHSLISFKEALRRVQDPACVKQFVFSGPVTLSESEVSGVLLLRDELRNRMEHFIPCSWLIQEAFFVPLMLDTCKAISEVFCCGNLVTYVSSLENVNASFDDVRGLLDRLIVMLREAQESSGTVAPESS